MNTATSTAPLFGAIADDLTGGAELASMLVARGVPTGFTIGAQAPLSPARAAHVIALKTRVKPADVAVREVLAAAERLIAAGCRQIFFKYCGTFDSTPLGNIGPCAEALMDRLGAEATLFCPHLIEVGLTVFQGHMFRGRDLLSDTPKRFDPLTPMTDSSLVRVLAAQSRRAVGVIGFETVDAGPAAIQARIAALAARGRPLLIVDGVRESDLATIAEASADLPLMTGNSSVAAHFPPVWRARGLLSGADAGDLPGIDGPAAVLAGSVADRTAEQLDHFGRAHPVIRLDLADAFQGADLAAQALEIARGHIAAGRPVAITTLAPPDVVAALQRAHGVDAAAAKAEAILASLASSLVEELGVRRLLVAGGETSGAVVQALGLTGLEVGAYLGPGLNRAVTTGANPIALVLKSGKLGPIEMFPAILEAMRHAQPAPGLDAPWPPPPG